MDPTGHPVIDLSVACDGDGVSMMDDMAVHVVARKDVRECSLLNWFDACYVKVDGEENRNNVRNCVIFTIDIDW